MSLGLVTLVFVSVRQCFPFHSCPSSVSQYSFVMVPLANREMKFRVNQYTSASHSVRVLLQNQENTTAQVVINHQIPSISTMPPISRILMHDSWIVDSHLDFSCACNESS